MRFFFSELTVGYKMGINEVQKLHSNDMDLFKEFKYSYLKNSRVRL